MDTSKQKPDLMAASRTSTGGGKRILAQLEHGAKAATAPAHAGAWTIDGWTVGLALLLLFMCGMAWLMHDRTITPVTFQPGHGSAPMSAAAAVAVAAVAAAARDEPPTPAVAVAVDEPEHQAATIVNQQVAQTATAASINKQAADRQADSGTPARVAQTAHKATGIGPGGQPAPTSATFAAARNASAIGDTDVALLAALVAHANQPSVVTPERSRDVVERQDGDSTATLLARCKQLGLIEGMLCRSRICTGRWESDAACRAPSR